MKSILFVFYLFGMVSPGIAQYTEYKQDSLLQVLETVKSETTIRTKANAEKIQLMKEYEEKARTDSTIGNWESAYRNKKLYLLYKDSLFHDEFEQKWFATQLEYEFAGKEDSLHYQAILAEKKLTQQVLLTDHQHQALLLRDKELDLILKEKEFHDIALTKSRLEVEIEKEQTARKQDQIMLVTKEGEVKVMETQSQRTMKNYLLVGVIILCILIAFGYHAYLTKQQMRLQQLRNKIASDLNEEVGSTLSSIAIFSEMARKQSSEVIPLLDTIGDSSRKMLEAMTDIVWTINPENDDVEKILDRMRSFAYELLVAKKIDFEFEADAMLHQLKLPMEVRKNLYLIFKEATNNMAKYAEANKVHFEVKREQKHLTLMIRDNGKGFNPELLSSGNGLRNMKRRAEEIGGTLRIDSRQDEGTTIKLSVAV